MNDLRGDFWAVVTSPVHADRSAILPLAALTAAFAVTTLRDSAVYAWMTSHPDAPFIRALGPLREGWKLPLYELGSGQYLLPLSGVAYVAGRLSRDTDLRDAGLGCIAAHLSSAALREILYLSVSRVRPHYSPSARRISLPGSRDWNTHAFPGGHAANAMACASFLSRRYELGGIEPLSFAYVLGIGMGRMADGWHWASDTMAGLTMGFAIGKFIADRQEARASARANAPSAAGETPLRIGWSFSF